MARGSTSSAGAAQQLRNAKKTATGAWGHKTWKECSAELSRLCSIRNIKDTYSIYLRDSYLPNRMTVLTKAESRNQKKNTDKAKKAGPAPVYGGSQEVFHSWR